MGFGFGFGVIYMPISTDMKRSLVYFPLALLGLVLVPFILPISFRPTLLLLASQQEEPSV